MRAGVVIGVMGVVMSALVGCGGSGDDDLESGNGALSGGGGGICPTSSNAGNNGMAIRNSTACPTSGNASRNEGENDVERALAGNALRTIQANLCVEPTGSYDDKTREAIRQAKIAARQGAQASPTMPFDNIENQIMSRLEAQVFTDAKSCSQDATGTDRGYLTAFEKFRFPGPVAINDLRRRLSACDHTLGDDVESFPPIRKAIANVKATAKPSQSAGFGDPASNTLNDQSYKFIVMTCIL